MTSDSSRARLSAALLVAGTLIGAIFAAGPVLVVREAVEQRGESIDGSAVVAPAFLSAVAVFLVCLAGWHRSFVGHESWTMRTRSHQVAGLAAATPVFALVLATTWSLVASRTVYPAAPLIAATVLPLVPSVAAAVLGTVIAMLSRRPLAVALSAALLGLGLLATVCVEPAFFGWAFLSACLFATSRTLRPRLQATPESVRARA